MSPSVPPTSVDATWFDGTQARGRGVRVAVLDGRLVLQEADGAPTCIELRQVQWPERTRHSRRVAHLQGGGSLDFADAAAFDAWRAAQGHRESWVVRAQQHWRATLAACALLAALVGAGYHWGVPWAAALVVAAVPADVEQAIGDAALAQLREQLLAPSKADPAVRLRLQQRLADAVAATYPPQERLPWTLHVAGGGELGANALALPGGHIVVTDELLTLLAGADDALLGVLAHEYGHLRRRHGLNALARFAMVSAATSLALGDFSAVLAGVPALLAHLGYSRDAEREADADAAEMLRASGRDPAVMLVLFERLAARGGTDKRREAASDVRLPIAFATHPSDDERIRFFREAGRR